jgi:hypothetical protein
VTFSDEKVVDFVNRNFVAAWESVAPVTISTFELGGGRRVRGALRGNIALYVCDPQGRVIDILPALQTPTDTLQRLYDDRALLDRLRGSDEISFERIVTAYHAARRKAPGPAVKPAQNDSSVSGWAAKVLKTAELAPLRPADPALLNGFEETVIQAGGLEGHMQQIHTFLAQPPLKRPEECTRFIFETVLGERLEGRREVHVTRDPVSLTVLPD